MTNVLWALIVVLVVAWFVGYVVAHVGGALVNVLLLLALVMLVWNLLVTPRSV